METCISVSRAEYEEEDDLRDFIVEDSDTEPDSADVESENSKEVCSGT